MARCFYVLGRAGVGWRDTLQVHPCSSMAPCSCALSCARGKSGVGRPAQPARGMPRAHGPTVPPPHPGPTRPLSTASDSKALVLSGGRVRSLFLRKRDLTRKPSAVAFASSFFLIFRGWRTRKLSKAGAVGSYGVSAAWMPRPSPRDGFTASLHDPTAPAKHGFCFDTPSHEGSAVGRIRAEGAIMTGWKPSASPPARARSPSGRANTSPTACARPIPACMWNWCR